MIKLPTLFKDDRQWTIVIDGDKFYTEFGKITGKKQLSTPTIATAKNIGKSNESTPEWQAEVEARSRWENKKDKGYSESNAVTVSPNTIPLPMLAHKYSAHAAKIVFPALMQPKLDGHRCIAVLKSGICTLYSRGGKIITSVPHINEDVAKCFKSDCVLDGELYSDMYNHNFQALSSLIRSMSPKRNHLSVQYWIYDSISDDLCKNRIFSMKGFIDEYSTDCNTSLIPVETWTVNSEIIALKLHAKFVESGYEGSIIRNVSGKYVGRRSYDLQKIKDFDDDEFEIVGVNPGKGKLAKCGIFCCYLPGGKSFDVKMTGPTNALVEYLSNEDEYIGRVITVRHQGFTNDGKPRFPIGLRFYEGD